MISLIGFADAVARYRAAGWPGVLPVPAGAKSPVPVGFTGRDGGWPSDAEYAHWRDHTGNVALRLPEGLLGIDIDAYKIPDARAQLEARTGSLPATTWSSSRDDGSGIYVYRVSPGLTFQTAPVAGV